MDLEASKGRFRTLIKMNEDFNLLKFTDRISKLIVTKERNECQAQFNSMSSERIT
jgi:hypothetical protein